MKVFIVILTLTIKVIKTDSLLNIEKEKLKKGENLNELGERTQKTLAEKGNVGILLDILNESEYLLTNPKIHLHRGYADNL